MLEAQLDKAIKAAMKQARLTSKILNQPPELTYAGATGGHEQRWSRRCLFFVVGLGISTISPLTLASS